MTRVYHVDGALSSSPLPSAWTRHGQPHARMHEMMNRKHVAGGTRENEGKREVYLIHGSYARVAESSLPMDGLSGLGGGGGGGRIVSNQCRRRGYFGKG